MPRSELNCGTILSIDFTKADQREQMIKAAEDMEEKEEKVVYVRLKLGHRLEIEKRKRNMRLSKNYKIIQQLTTSMIIKYN